MSVLCGAYEITHVKTGRVYYGSTNNLKRRKWDHLNSLKRNKNDIKELQKLYNEDQDLKWRFFVTEDREQAFDLEQKMVDSLWGSEIIINKSRDVRRGNFNVPMSDEQRKLVSEVFKGNKFAAGRIMTKEQRDQLSKRFKGKPLTEEHRRNVSKALKGRKLTEEDKKNKSMALLNSDKVKRKRVMIDGVVYSSIREAVRMTGLPKSSISFKAKSKNLIHNNFQFVN